MHTENFKGTHYNIGFTWGKALKNHGISILDGVPFPITEERIKFGEACTPRYKAHFPDILEEIRGIADSQECSETKLKAVLFNMYCILPSTNCSCFVAKSENGNILLGRNSDFLTVIEGLYMITMYTLSPPNHSFCGNTTAFVQMEDGINEHGLAVGLTSIAPKNIQAGLNAGMILRLFLEKCKTVDDILSLIHKIPIATCQTFVVADAIGNAALIECSMEHIEIRKIDDNKSYACSTNMFHLEAMKPYQNLPKDTWFAEERYETMNTFFSKHMVTVEKAKGLLSGKEGFICQYDRTTGKDTFGAGSEMCLSCF